MSDILEDMIFQCQKFYNFETDKAIIEGYFSEQSPMLYAGQFAWLRVCRTAFDRVKDKQPTMNLRVAISPVEKTMPIHLSDNYALQADYYDARITGKIINPKPRMFSIVGGKANKHSRII